MVSITGWDDRWTDSKDKVAIVTGGADGIGKAICELFAEEDEWVLLVDIIEQAGQAAGSPWGRVGARQLQVGDPTTADTEKMPLSLDAGRRGALWRRKCACTRWTTSRSLSALRRPRYNDRDAELKPPVLEPYGIEFWSLELGPKCPRSRPILCARAVA